MSAAIEQALAAALESGASGIGQIAISREQDRLVFTHRDDSKLSGLEIFANAEAAIAIAKFDDAGNYRPLKTAPNLRHGWRMELVDLSDTARALDYFYPGRLAGLLRWKRNELITTPLRETLDRQSGMYRVAAKISDEQIDDLVGSFCRTAGGCLRTILWKRDARGTIPSTKLPPEKFDPRSAALPLLCQEACNLLVNECRKVVKAE
ncbi:MAG: DR2241 family protein [Spartobacteria bacterium]